MVIINGEPENVAGMSVLRYLKEAGFEPDRVVVELNMEILPRESLGDVMMQDDDYIEILNFVGGG